MVDDPYRFLPTLGEMDLHLINEGRHELLWTVLGARVHHYERRSATVTGTSFAVWAPGARGGPAQGATSTAGTAASTRCASSAHSGVWELFVPGVGSGDAYKYVVLGADGEWREKADPMAFCAEVPPTTAVAGLRVAPTSGATTRGWTRGRRSSPSHEPMSVYEVHLASWRRGKTLGSSSPTSWPATSPTSASPTSS